MLEILGGSSVWDVNSSQMMYLAGFDQKWFQKYSKIHKGELKSSNSRAMYSSFVTSIDF